MVPGIVTVRLTNVKDDRGTAAPCVLSAITIALIRLLAKFERAIGSEVLANPNEVLSEDTVQIKSTITTGVVILQKGPENPVGQAHE